jgi:glycogen phosphorylase
MERYPGLPPIPDRIRRLEELACDLWWSWHYRARDVFRRLDYPLWRETAHNAVRMLRLVGRERLIQAAENRGFLALFDSVLHDLDLARSAQDTWWAQRFGARAKGVQIAYFSAEFALHQSLPLYAGGLGVLAGDTCKEASDLGVPLVGIGFMYPQGYFHQHLSAEGWQQESYERLDWLDAPIEPALRDDGTPCVVAVPLGDRTVLAAVWVVCAGRVRLYLLDTDLPENAPWDRELSARLYGGNQETRIQQEIVLGLGGVRALHAVGVDPTVWHLNEGHAAFVVLQRVRELIEHGRPFDDAVAEVQRTTVFTTHTPVAAGHDAFPFHLVEHYLSGAWGSLGELRDKFLALGAYDNGNGNGVQFNMTALALRSTGAVNAVSQLHRDVTRQMWAPIWPPDQEPATPDKPVRAITNGVHVPTWIATELSKLFEAYVAPEWRQRHDDAQMWDAVDAIPDDELWAVRQALRNYLFTFIRERARERWTEERVGPGQIVAAGTLLSPEALTIGFARRFAAYKRPELLFADPDRLARILSAARRPVQIVFAGKSHPNDDSGKHHLQRIYQRAMDQGLGGRVAFIDDYDLHVAHFLVQGCDVWLNTPRKPLEASGTSGMKAAVNGVPHLSIGDGWWAEGYTGANGWLIDGGSTNRDQGEVDAADADALYRVLEQQVVPTFYDRDAQGIPHAWLRVVKESIRTVMPRFSSRRMVKEYVESMYAPVFGGE